MIAILLLTMLQAGTPAPAALDATSIANAMDYYPLSAIRAGEEGSVRVELALDSTGLVDGCKVVASSGSIALDDATCRFFSERARFTPARDAGGVSVRTTLQKSMHWSLP